MIKTIKHRYHFNLMWQYIEFKCEVIRMMIKNSNNQIQFNKKKTLNFAASIFAELLLMFTNTFYENDELL